MDAAMGGPAFESSDNGLTFTQIAGAPLLACLTKRGDGTLADGDRPLPLKEPDRLMTFWLSAPAKGLRHMDLTAVLKSRE